MEESKTGRLTKLNKLKGQFGTILVILCCVNLLLWFIMLAYTVHRFASLQQQVTDISHRPPQQTYVTSHQKQSLTIQEVKESITTETADLRNQTYQQLELMVQLTKELEDLREDVEQLYSVHQNFNQFWVSLVEKISKKERNSSAGKFSDGAEFKQFEVKQLYSRESIEPDYRNRTNNLTQENPRDEIESVNNTMVVDAILTLSETAPPDGDYKFLPAEKSHSQSVQSFSGEGENVEVVSSQAEGSDYTLYITTKIELLDERQYSGEGADVVEGGQEFVDDTLRILKENASDNNHNNSRPRYTLPLPEQVIQLLACRQGPKGEQGADGLVGDKGAQGIPGKNGLRGAVGLPGPKGDSGQQGVKGERGEPGVDGVNGTQGEQGLKGDIGISGLPGIHGMKGERGQKGDQGVRGSQGDIGLPGLQGPQGIKGDPGEQGFAGIPGLKGDTGAKGTEGRHGLDGVNGRKGELGKPGADGAPGLKGEQGLQGAEGEPGLAGILGLQGPPGLPGQHGKDGAEVIIPDLFPADVIASVLNTTLMTVEKGGLRGPPGIDGIPGVDGTHGVPGTDGVPGVDGTNGVPGRNGIDGTPGTDGQPGTDGTPGQDGTDGRTILVNWFELLEESESHFLLNDHLYTFHRNTKSWQSAQSRCQGNGATLLILGDDYSQVLVKINTTVSNRPDRMWTGGKRNSLHEFEWINPAGTNQPIQSFLWNSDEPNDSNGNEDCAEIRERNKLNDIPCSVQRSYICMTTP